ncbi:MAG: type IIL restriction-modification enzyme MmeI, partial [Opitutaceae bacterium]
TFPFPWPLGGERAALDALAQEGASRAWAEAQAAHVYFTNEDAPPPPAGTMIEHVRAISKAAASLNAMRANWLGDRSDRQRTLTALYNAGPEWLKSAHSALDRAVAAAYGWPADIADDEVLARLLALNQNRAAASGR